MQDGPGATSDTPPEGLILRAPVPADAGLIGHYLGDARVARNLTQIPHPYPPGAAEALVARALSGKRSGPLHVLEADGQLVGVVFVNAVEPGVAQIAYVVGPPWWNTGYATEGAAAALDALFADGLDAVAANVFTDNDASAKVLTRLGFAYEGEGEEWSAGRGASAPVWRYRLTRASRDAAARSG